MVACRIATVRPQRAGYRPRQGRCHHHLSTTEGTGGRPPRRRPQGSRSESPETGERAVSVAGFRIRASAEQSLAGIVPAPAGGPAATESGWGVSVKASRLPSSPTECPRPACRASHPGLFIGSPVPTACTARGVVLLPIHARAVDAHVKAVCSGTPTPSRCRPRHQRRAKAMRAGSDVTPPGPTHCSDESPVPSHHRPEAPEGHAFPSSPARGRDACGQACRCTLPPGEVMRM